MTLEDKNLEEYKGAILLDSEIKCLKQLEVEIEKYYPNFKAEFQQYPKNMGYRPRGFVPENNLVHTLNIQHSNLEHVPNSIFCLKNLKVLNQG